jgi:hypothetical protein
MDSRGAPYVRRITGGVVKVQGYGVVKLARWLRVTAGLPARSGKDPIAHILWLKHEEPETYRRAHMFLEPKDWLNARLTGRLATSFDSIALRWVTDNRHPDRIRYDPALLRLAGIEDSPLPELLAATDILGPLSAEPAAALGVPAGIPVVVGTPDLESAAIGSGATRDYQAHLYIGTSSWLTCHVPFKKTSLLHNMASPPSPVPGKLPARPRTNETLRRSLPGIRGALPAQPQGLRPPQPRTCHMTDILRCYLRPGTRCRIRMAAVMAFAYPAAGMKLGGAMGRSRWIDTVWASVYLRIPCSPCLLPTPESFQPPIGASTDPHVAA